MKYIAYRSKLSAAGMLVFLSIFISFFIYFRSQMPLPAQMAFFGLITLAGYATIAALLSKTPVFVIDEDGISAYRSILKPIPWKDISGAIRLPRSQRLSKRSFHFMPFDSWRPVCIFIHDIERYTGPISSQLMKAQRGTMSVDHPGCTPLLLECAGTTAKSDELYSFILSHLKKKAQQGAAANP